MVSDRGDPPFWIKALKRRSLKKHVKMKTSGFVQALLSHGRAKRVSRQYVELDTSPIQLLKQLGSSTVSDLVICDMQLEARGAMCSK